jgi:hypothetical protein
VPLYHAPAADPRVLDNAPIAVLLAILPANFAAQEHDGRQLSAPGSATGLRLAARTRHLSPAALRHLASDPAVADASDRAPQDFAMRAAAAKLRARDPRAHAERHHGLEQAMGQREHRHDDVFGDCRLVAEPWRLPISD